MSLFSVMEPAERDAKYRYRSVPAIVTVAVASFGLLMWLAISLPGWLGLPAGIAVLAAGFLLLRKLVNLIVSRKFPSDEDF
jgi:fatty acid desaturase